MDITHVIFHLQNSWILYKEDCKEKEIPTNEIMSLFDIRMTIAHSLLAKKYEFEERSSSSDVSDDEQPSNK